VDRSSMFARQAIFHVLTVGRRMRTTIGGQTREAQVRAALNIQVVQTSVRGSLIATSTLRDDGRLDSATGCEFVDDRIRILE